MESLTFAQLIKPFIGLLWAMVILRKFGVRKATKTWTKHFIPFILWSFFVIIYSPTPVIAFQKTLSYAIILFCVPLFMLEMGAKRVVFFRRLIFFFMAVLFIGLVLRVIGMDVVVLAGRYRGLMGNPNGLGILLLCQFLLVEVIRYVNPKVLKRNEYYVFITVVILSLLLCRSRSAMLVFIVYFILGWIYKRSVSFGVIASVVLYLFTIVLIDYISVIIIELGLEKYMRLKRLNEGSGRIVAWDFAFQKIQDNFYTGRGFNYTIHMFRQNRPLLLKLNHQGNAHNSFLTFWLNTGLIGLSLFFYGLFRMLKRGAKKSPLMLPVFSCFMISATFESWLTASLNPFTIIFFITMTLLVEGKKEEVKEDAKVDVKVYKL
ncbi:MAG: O-antigen ligase family protein [Flavobacteriales bacterium]|nr:O-antigen ligase family protein [Flavobacteriales bacterium]